MSNDTRDPYEADREQRRRVDRAVLDVVLVLWIALAVGVLTWLVGLSG